MLLLRNVSAHCHTLSRGTLGFGSSKCKPRIMHTADRKSSMLWDDMAQSFTGTQH